MANRVSCRELVGRDEELALLMDLVARAAQGEGGAVLVTGEAGVGKSRLVGELGRRARDVGSQVLVGECADLAEAELSYAPIVGALRELVNGRSELELVRLFGPARAELARLLPELGEPAPVVVAPGGQARLFELLLAVFSRLGRERPVLLVLEDMHWADSASLDLLSFLVRNQRSERMAIVVTARSDEALAEGLTNRQIAAELYISEKTAEHHVSRILNKLGVHTRGAAGAIAHRIAAGAEPGPTTPP